MFLDWSRDWFPARRAPAAPLPSALVGAVALALLGLSTSCVSSAWPPARAGCFFVDDEAAVAADLAAPAVTANGSRDGAPLTGAGTDETTQTAAAPEPTTIREAIEQGSAYLKIRIRGETVDQRGLPKDAQALTVRSVLGYETARFHGFSALAEVENVSRLGPETYNDTYNGNTNRPVIADPTDTEINQAYLQYVYDDATVRGGRQRITLDNQRFIGNVGWRQNEQTFDAIGAGGKAGEVDYYVAYLANANRIFGDDSPMGDARMNSYLAHAKAPLFPGSSLTGYWYYLDFRQKSGLTGVSTSTVGGRYLGEFGEEGEPPVVDVLVEFARQGDVGDNPSRVQADYGHFKVTGHAGPVDVTAGYESLGGSKTNGGAFSTPLATLHAFNGWADKFLNTPPTGLEDTYVSVGGKVVGTKLLAVYHDFRSEASSADYGHEIDLAATRPIDDDSSWGAKYANYKADDFATDTSKFWLWYETRF